MDLPSLANIIQLIEFVLQEIVNLHSKGELDPAAVLADPRHPDLITVAQNVQDKIRAGWTSATSPPRT